MEEEKTCPYCGSKDIKKILYGIEAYTPVGEALIREGKALFVCCKTGFDDPAYQCAECGTQF